MWGSRSRLVRPALLSSIRGHQSAATGVRRTASAVGAAPRAGPPFLCIVPGFLSVGGEGTALDTCLFVRVPWDTWRGNEPAGTALIPGLPRCRSARDWCAAAGGAPYDIGRVEMKCASQLIVVLRYGTTTADVLKDVGLGYDVGDNDAYLGL